MDEASVTCSLDLSNRPFLVYDLKVKNKVGSFDTELVEEFFYAVMQNAGITCHIIQDRGSNKHHIIEASFKAFAVALRRALRFNEKLGIPSTKGVL
jgi:imidazoleglycerol-phosphate dehydratase